jgi:alpha-L-fucosidase
MIKKTLRTLMLSPLLLGLNAQAMGSEVVKPEEQVVTEANRMEWFRDAKLGIFIHWGLYSQLAGQWQDRKTMRAAEWIQEVLHIPTSEYAKLVPTWDYSKYDARAWVKLMKAAGAKYICITTKHHDGFALWPTKTNDDWNIMLTKDQKDLLKPLAEACREEGVKFSIYHSILDWRHKDWPGRPVYNDYATGTPDKERYKKEYLYPQLKELFSNYGDIGMLWLDGTWDGVWTSEDGKQLEEYIRTLQPSVVLNNRSGYKPPQPKYDFTIHNAYSYIFAGDYISPEGEIPPTGLPGIDWETCQTMQLPNNWGYNKFVQFRTPENLLHTLIDTTSKGGNLLLNIGPKADGTLPQEMTDRLLYYADWMKVNSQAIHGTTASPFEMLPFEGRCTRKGNTLYFHVFDWPTDGKITLPIENDELKVTLLDESPKSLKARKASRGYEAVVPEKAPFPAASVIKVQFKGDLKMMPLPVEISQNCPVKVSSEWVGRPELKKEHITDNNAQTMWATAEADRQGWVEVDLKQPRLISMAKLSDGPYHRTQSYELQAKVNGQWQTLKKGDSIGDRLHVSFNPVKAQQVRLVILKAKDTPTLANFQLFE